MLPDPGTGGAVDLRTNYYAQVRWVFTLLAALPLLSLLQELLLGERVERDLDTGVRIALAALAGTAAITRREWYHHLLAPVVAVILLAYVLVLFRQLP